MLVGVAPLVRFLGGEKAARLQVVHSLPGDSVYPGADVSECWIRRRRKYLLRLGIGHPARLVGKLVPLVSDLLLCWTRRVGQLGLQQRKVVVTGAVVFYVLHRLGKRWITAACLGQVIQKPLGVRDPQPRIGLLGVAGIQVLVHVLDLESCPADLFQHRLKLVLVELVHPGSGFAVV